MNRAIPLAVIRHVLTCAGGILIAQGWADDGQIQQLIGGLVASVGATWSILEKRHRSPAATTSVSPPTTLALALFLAFAGFLISGCKSPEVTAYRTIGTTATFVDRAMSAWGDYVRAGLATDESQRRVRELYEHYQGAMGVAKSAVIALEKSEEPEAWARILGAVDASAADLVAFIRRFTDVR